MNRRKNQSLIFVSSNDNIRSDCRTRRSKAFSVDQRELAQEITGSWELRTEVSQLVKVFNSRLGVVETRPDVFLIALFENQLDLFTGVVDRLRRYQVINQSGEIFPTIDRRSRKCTGDLWISDRSE